jgi:hypothetical protein
MRSGSVGTRASPPHSACEPRWSRSREKGPGSSPSRVNGDPFWIVRILRIIDALDADNSKVRRYAGGDIKAIETPAWHPDRVIDPCMFRLPVLQATIWATSGVAEAYESSGLSGLHFWRRGEVI